MSMDDYDEQDLLALSRLDDDGCGCRILSEDESQETAPVLADDPMASCAETFSDGCGCSATPLNHRCNQQACQYQS